MHPVHSSSMPSGGLRKLDKAEAHHIVGPVGLKECISSSLLGSVNLGPSSIKSSKFNW